MSLSEPAGGPLARPYEEIRALEARSRMDTGAILVDVREPAEWEVGHAEGARPIPLAQLGQRQHELPVGRSVIAVCRSGARSARADDRDRAPISDEAGQDPSSNPTSAPPPALMSRVRLRIRSASSMSSRVSREPRSRPLISAIRRSR
jgi:hypothetical protein